jgi:p-aminobenzoyl-glutamate transporter AbgT
VLNVHAATEDKIDDIQEGFYEELEQAFDKFPKYHIIIILFFIIIYLFTAIGFAPGGSSPNLVQTETIKQHYTVVQHNTIKRKQHKIKRKRKIIRT